MQIDVVLENIETTGEENPEVRVDLYQEDQHLIEIAMADFQVKVPRGAPVKVTVHVGKDYKMSAKAEIPSVPGAVKEEKDISIPVPPVPKVDDLRAEADRLRRDVGQFLQNFPTGDEKIRLGAETDRILNEVATLLDDTAPDVYRIQRLLQNLERLMKEQDYFQPSRNEMLEMFAKARQLLPQAEAKDESFKQAEMGKTLDVLAGEADKAYQKRDRQAWASVAESIKGICEQLERIKTGGGNGGGELPEAPVIYASLKALVRDLRADAAAKGRSGDPNVKDALESADREPSSLLEGERKRLWKSSPREREPVLA